MPEHTLMFQKQQTLGILGLIFQVFIFKQSLIVNLNKNLVMFWFYSLSG
jgi:hypothetical protein